MAQKSGSKLEHHAKMDFKKFEDDLFIYGCAAFQRIRDARPADHFYSFAFFTSGEFGYVAVTASSYEGLSEVAAQYQAMPEYSHRSIESLRKILKCSPCDSPLHGDPGGLIEELQPTTMELVGLFDSFDLDTQETEFDEFVREVHQAFFRALRRIDDMGLFGTGEERLGVVVNLLLGDQSDEERLKFAAELNPPDVVARFAREQEEAIEEDVRQDC